MLNSDGLVRENSMIKMKPKIVTRDKEVLSSDNEDLDSSSDEEVSNLGTKIDIVTPKQLKQFTIRPYRQRVRDYYSFNPFDLEADISASAVKFKTSSSNIIGIGDKNGTFWIYNIQNRNFRLKINAHFKAILDFDWNSKSHLVTLSEKNVRLWNLDKQDRVSSYSLKSKPDRVRFNPRNDDQFVVSDGSGQLHLFSIKYDKSTTIASTKPQKNITLLNTITSICWKDNFLIVGDYYGWIEIFEYFNGEKLTSVTLKNCQISIRSLDYDPNNSLLVVTFADFTIKYYNVPNLKEVKKNEEESTRYMMVRKVRFTPDGKAIVCGTDSGDVNVMETDTGSLFTTLTKHPSKISSITISENLDYIVTSSLAEDIVIWVRDKKSMLFNQNPLAWSTGGM